MGNFSRNTFNALKQYVGVRLQQGVPLVDADWNEQDDIRRFELRAYLKWFVGDGIPAGNNGFAIKAIDNVDNDSHNDENDFLIVGGDGTALGAGRCLVDGLDVFNVSDRKYSEQLLVNSDKAKALGVPSVDPLTTLPEGSPDKDYIVYLDVWEREVVSGNPSDANEDTDIFDHNLINGAIGVETCTRIKREWVVRVVPDSDDLVRLEGHVYYALARIVRRADDPKILKEDITDLRRTVRIASYNDTQQIARDAFGSDYHLDGDGEANLKLSLRDTVNSLLRGELPISPVEAVAPNSLLNPVFPKVIQDHEENTWYFWGSYADGIVAKYGDVYYSRYDSAKGHWDDETLLVKGVEIGNRVSVLKDKVGDIWVFLCIKNSEGDREIWYNQYQFANKTWLGNTKLSEMPASNRNQRSVIDHAGNIWVFWEYESHSITYNYFDAIEKKWTGETELANSDASLGQPIAIVDQVGNIWAFWSVEGGSAIDYKMYNMTSSTWGEYITLISDVGIDDYPEAIVDSAGDIWLFWRSDRSGKTELWYKIFSNGSWGDDTRLTTSLNDVDRDYSTIVDKYGDIWVIWSFSEVNRSDIWYARNQNGSWDKARNLTHDMTQTFHGVPTAVLVKEGGIQVSWSTKNEEGELNSCYRKIITSI